VNATREGHPDLATYVGSLGTRLGTRFKQTRKFEYLNEAIHRMKQAVETATDDNDNLAAMLNNLGNMLQI